MLSFPSGGYKNRLKGHALYQSGKVNTVYRDR